MAETAQGVALELAKIILAKGGQARPSAEEYSEENVLRVFRACLDAAGGNQKSGSG